MPWSLSLVAGREHLAPESAECLFDGTEKAPEPGNPVA
jgi:hypothetical protein